MGPKSGLTAISSELEKNFPTLGKLKPVMNWPGDSFINKFMTPASTLDTILQFRDYIMMMPIKDIEKDSRMVPAVHCVLADL